MPSRSKAAVRSAAVPEIRAEGLTLHQDSRLALDRSSFVIPSGAITAVIGPNGSGKSTLLHAIAGLIAPTAGSLHLDGIPAGEATSRIAYVFQSTAVNEFMPVTVREAVLMARFSTLGWLGRVRPDDREKVRHAMERLDLLPLGTRHLSELSGGQRQRTFVAQGLAQDHDLLLLDEPLTGLDAVNAASIDTVVHEEQAAGRTVVLTTHDLAEAAAADHVVLLAGRVVASGQPGTVLTPDHLAEAYGSGHRHDHPDVFLDDPAHATGTRHVHRSRE